MRSCGIGLLNDYAYHLQGLDSVESEQPVARTQRMWLGACIMDILRRGTTPQAAGWTIRVIRGDRPSTEWLNRHRAGPSAEMGSRDEWMIVNICRPPHGTMCRPIASDVRLAEFYYISKQHCKQAPNERLRKAAALKRYPINTR